MILEDDFNDILTKAQEGQKISDESLATRAEVTPGQLASLKAGQLDPTALKRVAPLLGLHPEALLEIAEHRWQPLERSNIPGLATFRTPCGTNSMTNAYLVWDLDSRNGICFDTGTDATEMLRFAAARSIRIQMVLLTHSHSDHISAWRQIADLTDARPFIDKPEAFEGAETFDAGRNFRAGRIIVGTRPTPGHSRGGITYVLSETPCRIAIVGDCLFAGSMGRPFHSYSELMQSNCEQILSLPEDTLLCPGHGPLTTVGEEKLHNPFFIGRVGPATVFQEPHRLAA